MQCLIAYWQHWPAWFYHSCCAILWYETAWLCPVCDVELNPHQNSACACEAQPLGFLVARSLDLSRGTDPLGG
ncbi:hypothetical protein B0H14DRAFT_2885395 [Mycena olivaceomarginata]|nr:hypothetical protein B0H14DRAFT_3027863 [Mycena olivaceomarginata]KAJ7804106.1 hypothetical protein B0H14DRAFT_2885395 [Mycena olivaceomarginata]